MQWYDDPNNFPCIIQSINDGALRISYGVRDVCHRDSTATWSSNIGLVSNMVRAHPGHTPVAKLIQRACDAPETCFEELDNKVL